MDTRKGSRAHKAPPRARLDLGAGPAWFQRDLGRSRIESTPDPLPLLKVAEIDEALKLLVEGSPPSDPSLLVWLERLGFVDGKTAQPTDAARQYHFQVHVLGDTQRASSLLQAPFKSLELVQLICASLWGSGPVTLTGLASLLKAHRMLAPSDDIPSLLPFVHLLNALDIIKYARKDGTIRVVYNPATDIARPEAATLEEAKATAGLKPFSPSTPYTNIRQLWDILRQCEGYIWWADPHFSLKGLEPLADEGDGQRINEIRILSGPANVNEKAKSIFERFREEMKHRGIQSDWRVQEPRTWHDRWVIAKNVCFNVPPINTVFKGDTAEAFRTSNRPAFDDWWNLAHSIL